MAVIKRIRVCFVILFCLPFNQLRYSAGNTEMRHTHLLEKHPEMPREGLSLQNRNNITFTASQKTKTNRTNLVRMDTSCSVVPCCATSHSSSSAARSALASTGMATAIAADTADAKADDKAKADDSTADMSDGGSSSWEDIAAWSKEGRGANNQYGNMCVPLHHVSVFVLNV